MITVDVDGPHSIDDYLLMIEVDLVYIISISGEILFFGLVLCGSAPLISFHVAGGPTP